MHAVCIYQHITDIYTERQRERGMYMHKYDKCVIDPQPPKYYISLIGHVIYFHGIIGVGAWGRPWDLGGHGPGDPRAT